jgi:hypothetical protein
METNDKTLNEKKIDKALNMTKIFAYGENSIQCGSNKAIDNANNEQTFRNKHERC